MGFSIMLWGAENMVPAEYWCPYGTCDLKETGKNFIKNFVLNSKKGMLRILIDVHAW